MTEVYNLIQQGTKYYLELRGDWGTKEQKKIIIQISKTAATKILKEWGYIKCQCN